MRRVLAQRARLGRWEFFRENKTHTKTLAKMWNYYVKWWFSLEDIRFLCRGAISRVVEERPRMAKQQKRFGGRVWADSGVVGSSKDSGAVVLAEGLAEALLATFVEYPSFSSPSLASLSLPRQIYHPRHA
jgi:hypothetical protein